VLIDWSLDFDQWLSGIEKQGGPALRWTTAMLAELQDLEKKPVGDSATFKRIRQARRHELVAGQSSLRQSGRRTDRLLVPG
jgi:hypothetical protein